MEFEGRKQDANCVNQTVPSTIDRHNPGRGPTIAYTP